MIYIILVLLFVTLLVAFVIGQKTHTTVLITNQPIEMVTEKPKEASIETTSTPKITTKEKPITNPTSKIMSTLGIASKTWNWGMKDYGSEGKVNQDPPDLPTASTNPDLFQKCAEGKGGWKRAYGTFYSSYPTTQNECITYSGCKWQGQFAAVDKKYSYGEVVSSNIVAMYPNFDSLKGKKICLKHPNGNSLIATVLDTCSNSDDVSGANVCSSNAAKGGGQLIDVERFTATRLLGLNRPIKEEEWSNPTLEWVLL